MSLSTIGNPNQGATEDAGYSGAIAAIQVVIPKAGRVTESRCWVKNYINLTNARMALYADAAGSPGARKLLSPDVTMPAGGPQQVLFNLIGAVAAGTYWLAIGFNTNASGISIMSDAGTHVYNLSNGSCPDPFGVATAQGTLSMGISLTFDDSPGVLSWFRRRIRRRDK